MDKKYDYNCLMIYYKILNWEEIIKSLVDFDDVYDPDGEYGIESDPHLTILYGLHEDVSVDDVKSLCEPLSEYKTVIGKINVFECEGYDVLKFDVQCDTAVITNERLTDVFNYTSDFDKYVPHITIAYLNPGSGKKYMKKLLEKQTIYPNEFVYSNVDGTKDIFTI